jgi:hypothetical protein
MVGGVLLLYHHPLGAGAPTIQEHVDAFSKYSRFRVWPINVACGFPAELAMLEFGVIVLHYSLFGSYPFRLNRRFIEYLRGSRGSHIVAFFQDEHQYCRERFALIDDLRIARIYSCLEQPALEAVYTTHTQCRLLHHTLTGYVDDSLVVTANALTRSDADRTIDIGYRARPLPYYMGRGAQEKTRIAHETVRRLQGSDLKLDIKTAAADRIYGKDWYRFVTSCRGMIGVEAGVSVFDLDGSARRACDEMLARKPDATFEEVHDAVLWRWEDKIPYRTLSPRVFEAAAFRTCMILFEGSYNGSIQPMVHYIPLKKDFSNFNWVIETFRNPNERARLTARAYEDLIGSGRYSSRHFIAEFDDTAGGNWHPASRIAGPVQCDNFSAGKGLGCSSAADKHCGRHQT